ncbi:MAG: ABC transporter permease [Treponema sp.]|nr:ABC transporter permease [Treponema sp.]
MVFFLALRNIARNKKNSIITALLIAIIIFIFFIGNIIIERSNVSLHDAFIKSITGDVVIQKKGDVSMNLFGANTPVIDYFFVIPVLPAYDMVMEIVRAADGVSGITSQVSGNAIMDFMGAREAVLLCGPDVQNYFTMFSGVILEEGRFLRNGEYGAMITKERALKIKEKTGSYPEIGSLMLLTSGSDIGFKIREVPLTGIFSYQNPGLFMNEIVITDPQTVRVLNSIQVAASVDVNLTDNDLFMFSADIDDLFGFDYYEPDEAIFNEAFTVDYLNLYLSETSHNTEDHLEGGGWNFIIISLEEGVNPGAFIKSLNRQIEPFGVTAVDWRVSAGTSAMLLLLIQVLFNAGMFLVCIAGVITVINIQLISVFRRTREIGTLRAIGASDFYIGFLILCESVILSAAAGVAGIFGSSLFIKWINSLALNIQNDLIASLFGGAAVNLAFVPSIAVISVILSVVLGVIVSIYPVNVTLRIEPMEAVRQG